MNVPLKQRIVHMLFALEWANNNCDGHGPRCPVCDSKQNDDKHNCALATLMRDIRDAKRERDTSLDDVDLPRT